MFYDKWRKPTLSDAVNFTLNVAENTLVLFAAASGISWLADKFSRFIPKFFRSDSYINPITLGASLVNSRIRSSNKTAIANIQGMIERNKKLKHDAGGHRLEDRLKIHQAYAADEKRYSFVRSIFMFRAMSLTTRAMPTAKDDLPKLCLAAAVGLELSTYAYEPLLYAFEQSGLKANIYDPVINAIHEVQGSTPEKPETEDLTVCDPEKPRDRPWGTPRSILPKLGF